jgi:hypothetical protein
MLFSFYHGKFNIWLSLELFYFILKIPCQKIVSRIFNEIIYFPSQEFSFLRKKYFWGKF